MLCKQLENTNFIEETKSIFLKVKEQFSSIFDNFYHLKLLIHL